MADGIYESADLIAHRESSGDAPVFSGRDEFSHGGDKTIGGKRTGLLQNSFFRRQIDDTADNQVCDVLAQFFGRLILKYPFVPIMNENVLLFTCLDREHGDVPDIDAEQSLILEGEEIFGQIFDRRGADFVNRPLCAGLGERFPARRVRLKETYHVLNAAGLQWRLRITKELLS